MPIDEVDIWLKHYWHQRFYDRFFFSMVQFGGMPIDGGSPSGKFFHHASPPKGCYDELCLRHAYPLHRVEYSLR